MVNVGLHPQKPRKLGITPQKTRKNWDYTKKKLEKYNPTNGKLHVHLPGRVPKTSAHRAAARHSGVGHTDLQRWRHSWLVDKDAIETETSTGDVVKKYRDIDMDIYIYIYMDIDMDKFQ